MNRLINSNNMEEDQNPIQELGLIIALPICRTVLPFFVPFLNEVRQDQTSMSIPLCNSPLPLPTMDGSLTPKILFFRDITYN